MKDIPLLPLAGPDFDALLRFMAEAARDNGYATSSFEHSKANYQRHAPQSPLQIGWPAQTKDS